MKYRAIISDIDGTLIPNDPHALPSKRVKSAIRKVLKKGIKFVLATGRPLNMLQYILDDLNYSGLLILDNGAIIYDANLRKNLWESTLTNRDANEVLKLALTYVDEIGTSTNIGRLNHITEIDPQIKVYKHCVIGLTPSQADAFVDTIQNKYKRLSVVRASSYEGHDRLDVYVANANATKQHAVLKLSELLQIPTKEMVALGDHYNDFPLFMACGFKIAMGNAVEDLKAIADDIAPSVAEDGAAVAIEKYFLASKVKS
jgi:HAD superfamily hydrolase (TIGR01484 family)